MCVVDVLSVSVLIPFSKLIFSLHDNQSWISAWRNVLLFLSETHLELWDVAGFPHFSVFISDLSTTFDYIKVRTLTWPVQNINFLIYLFFFPLMTSISA